MYINRDLAQNTLARINTAMANSGQIQLDLGSLLLDVGTVAAAGSTQANAIASAPVATTFCLVSAADGTKGVALPTPTAGQIVIIKNNANAALKVYPQASGQINAVGANNAFSCPCLTSFIAAAYNATQWYTVPLLPS